MSRFNCWLSLFVVALFSFAFLPQSALAAEETLEAVRAKNVMLEQKETQLRMEVARLDAQIAAARPLVVAMHVSPVPVSHANKVTLVEEAEITAQNPAEGWYAWKRQSREYKKAHPWEGATGVWCSNSTRLGIPCTEAAWKKVPAGTVFLLPSPEVRVLVPAGMTPPEAIMLAPTAGPHLLQLAPLLPVVTKNEQRWKETAELNANMLVHARDQAAWNLNMVIIFGISVLVALMTFFVIIRKRDETIAALKKKVDATCGCGISPS